MMQVKSYATVLLFFVERQEISSFSSVTVRLVNSLPQIAQESSIPSQKARKGGTSETIMLYQLLFSRSK